MRKFLASFLLSLLALNIFALEAVKPEAVYPEIARRVVSQIGRSHLSGEAFNDRLSAVAWTNLVDSVDFDRTLFTQKDITNFASQKTKLDDLLRRGDLAFGYDMINLARERFAERCDFVEELLKQENPFDFTQDESFVWKRRKAERPADRAAQKDLWRAALKNEYLALVLTQELDAEEEKNKSAEDKKKEAEEKKNNFEDEDLTLPVADILRKRYRALRVAFCDTDSETALQRYLSAVATAYDPHTDYMSPMNFEDFNMGMNLTLCGIGATLRYDDGMVRITEIMPGAPAARDKRDIRLREGDRIIGVAQGDGEFEDIRYKPLSKTVRKIRGPKGSKVVLKVIPVTDKTGTRTKIVDIVRDEIHLDEQAVTGRIDRLMTEKNEARRFGYVRIPAFYAGAVSGDRSKESASMTRDLLKYVQRFNASHVDGLIVDLRNNGGGSLLEAITMNNLFVSGPVVQVKDTRSTEVLSLPQRTQAAFRKPMAVLVNRNSASASEIVASALQDYGRAIVIGDSKTHGKGTVQTVQGIGNNKVYGANRITTACFYRINGGTTQLRGVVPDIVLPSIFDALETGEDQLPGALPYSTVPPAYYAKTDDLGPFLPRLKEKSAKRLAKDDQYTAAQKLIAHVRKANAENSVTLKKEARRERMKAERAIQKLQDEAIAAHGAKGQKEPTYDNDPVLREAAHILSDFIDLRGGPVEPLDTDGDISRRLYNIFR